jgi:hypothetical protein
MANIQITQLPAAGAITGTEAVPIVQNGVTVQTTTAAISASPSLTATFLTKNQEPTLPNSRVLSGGTGIGLVDGGAQSTLQITLNRAAGSLEAAGTGIVAKTSSTTVAPRTLTATGNGISITDGSGVSGNPTFQLTGIAAAIAGASGTGMLAIVGGTTIAGRQITGTANQIAVTDGNGAGNPTISLANNAVLPGTESVTVPIGATGARPVSPVNGMLRYSTTFQLFEGYINNTWQTIAAGSGVTSIATGTGLQGGPITSTGTISIANSGATAGTYGSSSLVPTFTVNAQGQLTAVADLAISATAIGAVTAVTGTANEITSTGGQTPVISLPNALTFTSKTVTGGAFNMASAQVASDTVTTNTAAQTLTNKTINGAANTLTNIANASLTNSSLTVGSTNIALGAVSLTLGGLTSVTLTQDPTTNFQAATKQYVDNATSTALTYHDPTQAATTATLASITGGTVTYNNGAAGVGATLTLSNALTVLDGYTLLNTNRILVKNEANQANNGVYTWATGGTVLTRATDADTYGSSTNQLSLNSYFFTQNGTVNKGTSFVVTTVGTITFGTTAITFAEFSTSQVYTGTSPINVSGTVISLTTVPVNLGGTNITSYTVGDLLYATGSTTLTKLPIGVAGRVLKSTGTAPDWQLNPTYLPVILHNGSSTSIPVASGYLPVLLNDGVTTVNVALF